MKKTSDWKLPFALIFLIFMAYVSANSVRDGDVYFMIANGEYILKHGFPRENPFVIADGLKIVIQQWIPSVLSYLGYKAIGWEFFRIEAVIGLLLLFYVFYKISDDFLSAAVLLPFLMYLYVGKPMLYSMVLLAAQIYVCEKKKSWWWLPIIVLIEANVHASFIAFHFVYLLPYIVPGIKPLKNTADYRYLKSVPLMAVAAILNPYGLDGALYLFRSFNDKLTTLPITELEPLTIKQVYGAMTLIFIIYIVIRVIKTRNLNSSKIYMLLGSLLLLVLFPQQRNHIFVIMGSLPIYTATLPAFKGKTPPAKGMWALAVCGVIALITFMPDLQLYPMSEKGADYLRGKECILYTGFNEGAYYEMMGQKVFVDARPELYFKSLNGKADVIDDYLEMMTGNENRISLMVNKYGFTHFSVRKDSYLVGYLKERGYKLVATDDDYYLFERKNL